MFRLQEWYPRWGKDKVVLFRREGRQVSTSIVGGILGRYLLFLGQSPYITGGFVKEQLLSWLL